MKRAAILASLLLGACTVGPDYAEPQLTVPAGYHEASGSGTTQLDQWWQGFGDAQLTTLVERSLTGNLDIEMATARIREARAMERVAGAGASPQVAVQGSVNRQRISENAIPLPPGAGSGSGIGIFGLPGEEFTTFRAGFDASWELDLFGRNKREREAAAARTGSAVWNRRDAEVTVAGFRVSGEGAMANADIPPGLRETYASRQAGWYVDVARDVGAGWVRNAPGSRFTLKARVDAIDLDTEAVGQHVRQAGAGINFRPTSESVIKLELVRGWQYDRFNNRSDFARLLASLPLADPFPARCANCECLNFGVQSSWPD